MNMRPIFFALIALVGAAAPAMAQTCYEAYPDWVAYPGVDRIVLAEDADGHAGRFFIHTMGSPPGQWWRSDFTCMADKKGSICNLPATGERFFMRPVPVDEITLRPTGTISFDTPAYTGQVKLGDGLYDFLGFDRMYDGDCTGVLASTQPLEAPPAPIESHAPNLPD